MNIFYRPHYDCSPPCDEHAAEADRGTGDPLRKAAQEFLWEAQAYRTAHYNGTHMTADGTAAWAVREREFEKKAKALRAVLDARITEVTK